MSEQVTVEEMEGAAQTYLAIDRAAGVPIPKTELIDDIYQLGFASGAAWALQKIGMKT